MAPKAKTAPRSPAPADKATTTPPTSNPPTPPAAKTAAPASPSTPGTKQSPSPATGKDALAKIGIEILAEAKQAEKLICRVLSDGVRVWKEWFHVA